MAEKRADNEQDARSTDSFEVSWSTNLLAEALRDNDTDDRQSMSPVMCHVSNIRLLSPVDSTSTLSIPLTGACGDMKTYSSSTSTFSTSITSETVKQQNLPTDNDQAHLLSSVDVHQTVLTPIPIIPSPPLPRPQSPICDKNVMDSIRRRANNIYETINQQQAKMFKSMGATFLVVMFLAILVMSNINQWSTRVSVSETIVGLFGTAKGFRSGVGTDGKEVFEYLGISFAVPALGALRFRKPQKMNWTRSSIPLNRKRSLCMQPNVNSDNASYFSLPVTPSEDCLHLNIWAPRCQRGSNGQCLETMDVIILFGGVEFRYGGSMLGIYNGSALALHGQLIVVVPNYRLGIFGFLNANHEDIEGNAGLEDQLLAIEWVMTQISSFGGNNSKISLMGHNVGATSLTYLLHSSKNSQLKNIKRIILLGKSLYSKHFDNTNDARNNFRELSSALECNDFNNVKEIISCLQKQRPENFLMYTGHLHDALAFTPSFKTRLLPYLPYELSKQKHHDVDFLVGGVVNEAAQLLLELGYAHDIAIKGESELFLPPNFFMRNGLANFDKLSQFYTQSSYYLPVKNSIMFHETALSDIFFTCPLQYYAEQQSYVGNRVYRFVFGYKPTWSIIANDDFTNKSSSSTFDELAFFLGFPLVQSEQYSDVDRKLSRRMIATLTSFVRNGTMPQLRAPGESYWPPFSHNRPQTVIIGSDRDIITELYRQHECDFLKDFILNDTRYTMDAIVDGRRRRRGQNYHVFQ